MDEKDRFGDKLRERERAEEDRYFAERDRAALDKIKAGKAAENEASLQESSKGRCPKCGLQLTIAEIEKVVVEQCPSCHGIWLDDGELKALAHPAREGWLSRFLRNRIEAIR